MSDARIRILGVPVDSVTFGEALERVYALLQGARPAAVIAINPEKIVRAQEDPALRGWIERAGLLIPDGIGVVYASRLLPTRSVPERVAGVDLMVDVCRASQDWEAKVFVLGGRPEVNEAAVARLRADFQRIDIAGCQHGYFKPEESDAVVERINASGARLLLVALGSPRQENWMEANLERLKTVRVALGVGGSLDVLAGTVKRAPAAWRRLNGEWLYRLLVEPRRIRRQVLLPVFAKRVLVEAVRRRLGRTA